MSVRKSYVARIQDAEKGMKPADKKLANRIAGMKEVNVAIMRLATLYLMKDTPGLPSPLKLSLDSKGELSEQWGEDAYNTIIDAVIKKMEVRAARAAKRVDLVKASRAAK